MKFQSIIHLTCLVCCFTLQLKPVYAQIAEPVFAPIGASWYYSSVSIGPPWIAAELSAYFLVEKDTFMLGVEARIIGCYVNDNNQIIRVDSLTKYVATVGDKVYYKVEDEFVLLYDFGAQAGDTIQSKVEDFEINIGCDSDFSQGVIDFSYVVDSVGTLFFNGEELRVLFVQTISQSPDPDWVFWYPIVERIGPMGWGGLWWGRGENCILESGYLRCYIDQEITWRSSEFSASLPCDYISATSEIQAKPYTIHPNPASTHLTLPSGAEDIGLCDITGRSMRVNQFDNEIEIASYPAGMYIIRFELDGVLRVASFMKILN
ncbi:MAG TPA: T9SS type A sorting domain-containing protein [Saprospiraceae bacterium]|nr:T9SS type A sorting domain-containing protein [Saprospiraceae bacterium]